MHIRLHLLILGIGSIFVGKNFAAAREYNRIKHNNIVLTAYIWDGSFDIRTPYHPDITIAELKQKVQEFQRTNFYAETPHEHLYLVQSTQIHHHVFKKRVLDNDTATLHDYKITAAIKLEVEMQR